MSAIVAIMRRPNVGKSASSNRLIRCREAIVDTADGVARDHHYDRTDWSNVKFSVVDTRGYLAGDDGASQKEINRRVNLAIDEAGAIISMVNIEDGLTGMDGSVAALLRKSKKPVFVVVNKVNSNSRRNDAHEFCALGFEHLFSISNINSSGTDDLLDELVKSLPKKGQKEEESLPRFTIVGGPSTGKSSFISALIGEDRYIVTDITRITHDAIDTRYNRFGFEFNLIGTVGIRRKSKVEEDLEFYSVIRSIRAIKHSSVCILMLDATRGFESQDANTLWLTQRNRKGIMVLVNKWDLMERENSTARAYGAAIREEIEPFTDVPIIFVLALNKQRIYKAIETAVEVYNNHTKHIPTRQLNEVILPIMRNYPPPAIKGEYVKIKFCAQLPTSMPRFTFFANLPQYIKDPYRRFIENKLRENSDFKGIPIDVYLRQK